MSNCGDDSCGAAGNAQREQREAAKIGTSLGAPQRRPRQVQEVNFPHRHTWDQSRVYNTEFKWINHWKPQAYMCVRPLPLRLVTSVCVFPLNQAIFLNWSLPSMLYVHVEYTNLFYDFLSYLYEAYELTVSVAFIASLQQLSTMYLLHCFCSTWINCKAR